MILDVSGDVALWATHPVNKNDKNLFKIKSESLLKPVLLDEELAHRLQVVDVDNADAGEVSLLLLGLLGQDVTLVSMFSFNLPCSGKGEPFFGTGISFNFWHFVCY